MFELCFSAPFLELAEEYALISLLIYVNNLHVVFKKNYLTGIGSKKGTEMTGERKEMFT